MRQEREIEKCVSKEDNKCQIKIQSKSTDTVGYSQKYQKVWLMTPKAAKKRKMIQSHRRNPIEDKGFISRTCFWVQVLGYGTR